MWLQWAKGALQLLGNAFAARKKTTRKEAQLWQEALQKLWSSFQNSNSYTEKANWHCFRSASCLIYLFVELFGRNHAAISCACYFEF
jgi:hypothetical protein